jgi:hypothetical protein
MTNKIRPEARRATVTDIATRRARLNLRETILLGTFGAEGELGALLRLPTGAVQKVHKGDAYGKGTIIAIGENHVIIEKTGRTTTLVQPQPRAKARQSGA